MADRQQGGGVRFLCLRHGESANVVDGLAGALPLAPLTARGREQATTAGRALRDQGVDQGVVRVCASTALRARETARLVAAELGPGAAQEVLALPELVEVGLGREEGSADPAVRARTAAVLHAWVVGQDLDARVADGENGHQVAARVRRAFDGLADGFAGGLADGFAGGLAGGTVVVVGHVASLTAGLGLLCGLGARVWGTPLAHAAPFEVHRGDDGRWVCPSWPGAAEAGR